MKRFSLTALLLGASSLLSLDVSTAIAQSDSSSPVGAETIVITGTRQAYRGAFAPLETPQAQLLISEQMLINSGALDLDQALDLSASVARQNNFGGLWNSFAVRGFVGDENLPSNYLVNGFNAGRGFGGPRDLSGIESVEVLKGPRAALFGRGEPGGTINLVSKRPTFETAGEFRLSAGSFETYRADGDWTGPVGDMLAVRFVGFYEDADSFRDNIETRKYGLSPSVALRIGDATQVVYELEFARLKVPFDRGVVAVNGRLDAIPKNRFLGEPGDGPIESRVAGHQIELQHHLNTDWSVLAGVNLRDTSLKGFSTEAEVAANRQLLLVDGQTLSRQRRFRDYDAAYRIVRAEIEGRFDTGSIVHRLLAGADADRFKNDQFFLRARPPTLASNPTLQQMLAINIFDPAYGQFPLPAPGPLTDRVEIQRSMGVFVQDQLSVTDRLDIRVGARYDDYRQELINRATGTTSLQTETRLSPQAGAVFKATRNVSIYATYGRNFRPLSGADFAGKPFEPNTSTAVEAGVKFDLRNGVLVGTGSVFQIKQENILVSDPVNAGFTVAAGKARSRGFEFDLQGEIADDLDLWVSYAYVNAEVSNDVLEPNFALPVKAGDRLLNVPKHSLSLQMVKGMEVMTRPLKVGGGITYVGERLGEIGTRFTLPAYALARVFAAYEVTEAATLRLEVDNLFNKTHYLNSFSQLWLRPGAPRSARVSAAVRF
jgi:iron complex outermembrane receptor protein